MEGKSTKGKNILVRFFLLITGLLSICAYGQKVAVIEKNNFFSQTISETGPLSYKISIRELFEFKDQDWQPVYNYRDTVQIEKFRVQYLYAHGKNNNQVVTGIRKKPDNKHPLASELFLVKNPGAVQLKKLSPEILHGFEHRDIIAVGIVTDKIVKKYTAASFRSETLTAKLRDKVLALLKAKYDSCAAGLDSGYRHDIRTDQIERKLLIGKNGYKLGRVNIRAGELCFAEEYKSYGGGILYFVVYPDGEIKLLVTNLQLIDVGDYNNDGKFEYIFIKSWFNNYGYIMYYDDFNRSVVNEWSYH